jgi:hypothetical protein
MPEDLCHQFLNRHSFVAGYGCAQRVREPCSVSMIERRPSFGEFVSVYKKSSFLITLAEILLAHFA